MNYIKDITLRDEPPMSEGVQYTTGEEWRTTTNSSRKNAVAGQSGNDTQLWMCLAVKENPVLLRTVLHEPRKTGHGQAGDDNIER